MKIVKRSVELINPPTYKDLLTIFNTAARNCYRSESGETNNIESEEKMARFLLKNGHLSTMEHNNIAVKIIADRAFMGQITRHRIASFSIESMRYCNYSLDKFDNQINVIEPYDIQTGYNKNYNKWWKYGCEQAELSYFKLLKQGVKPETARSVLPQCTATSIVMSTNIREWRHILELRCDEHAQPDMRDIMNILLEKLYNLYPAFFADLYEIK